MQEKKEFFRIETEAGGAARMRRTRWAN